MEPERHSQECQGFCRDTGQWGFFPNKAARESSCQELSCRETCGLWINQLVINFLSLGSKATLRPCSVRTGAGPCSYIMSSASCTIRSCTSRGWWKDIKVRCAGYPVSSGRFSSSSPGAGMLFLFSRRQHKRPPASWGQFAVSFKTLHLSMGGFSRKPREGVWKNIADVGKLSHKGKKLTKIANIFIIMQRKDSIEGIWT